MSKRLTLSLLALASALMLATSAGANGGRSPRRPPTANHPNVVNVTCGQDLTVSIVLSGDLDCSGFSGTAVTLEQGVKLDLGGHTLTVHSTNVGVNSVSSNVTVTNGTITGGVYGVAFHNAFNATASKLTVTAITEDIDLEYMGASTVTGNTLHGPDYGVVAEYGSTNKVTSNTVDGITGGYGIYNYYEVGDTIGKNTVTSDSTSYGYYEYESTSNTYSSNTSTGGKNGFYVEEDKYGPVTLSGNTVTGSARQGYYFYENYNELTLAGSTYTGNKAINSGTGGYAGFYSGYDTNSKWTGNSATGGGGYGFQLDYAEAAAIKGNTASGNADTGFYIEDNYSLYQFASFTGNTANSNSDYGFYADDFVALGSGNKAKLNTPKDCYNVTCPAGATAAAVTNR